MQRQVKERHTVSYHIKDLGKLDVSKVLEISKWLDENAVKPRDVARRTVSRRLFNRHIAAKLALKAADGDVAAIREWMDRGEGKVSDRLEISETRTLNLHLDLGDAHPERILRQPVDSLLNGHYQTGKSLTPGDASAVRVGEEVAEEPQPVRTPSTLLSQGETGVGGERPTMNAHEEEVPAEKKEEKESTTEVGEPTTDEGGESGGGSTSEKG